MTVAEKENRGYADLGELEAAFPPSDNRASLDKVIEQTESSLSLQDFEPAKIQAAASFDVSEAAGQLKWISAQNGKHADLAGMSETVITVNDWVCWQKDVINPNGEVRENAWVLVLWTQEKGTISTASEYTVPHWAAFARAIRSGKIKLPIRVKLIPNQSKIKGGNPWYSILPVME